MRSSSVLSWEGHKHVFFAFIYIFFQFRQNLCFFYLRFLVSLFLRFHIVSPPSSPSVQLDPLKGKKIEREALQHAWERRMARHSEPPPPRRPAGAAGHLVHVVLDLRRHCGGGPGADLGAAICLRGDGPHNPPPAVAPVVDCRHHTGGGAVCVP